MHFKSKAKALIGRLLPVDFAEKLTEYSVAQHAKSVSLSNSTEIIMPGNSWQDVVERGREELWRRASETIGVGDLLFLEFGVWKGYSIDYWSKLNSSPNSRFFGFDSFEGLPSDWRGMKAGHFGTDGRIPEIPDDRVEFFKGWFQDTLPNRIDELVDMAQKRTVLIHFDADLYSSTLYVLCMLAPRLGRFYCLFDEYSGHEQRALYNFNESFGASCRFKYHVSWRDAPTTAFGEVMMPSASSH